MIYLDSAATTPVSGNVMAAMMPYFSEKFGNAGSVHNLGSESRRAIEHARSQVARLFGTTAEHIVFNSGATEGNYFALTALSDSLMAAGKKHVIVSSVEHDSVLRAAESLMKCGFDITYLPVAPDGSVDFNTFVNLVRPNTGFVSVMYINNETGAINPVHEIGEYCHNNGIIFHTDCVQAVGTVDINVEDIQCDFATVSAHKFYGPKGVGAIYVKNPQWCIPMIQGGLSQEFGLRGGTENIPGIVGLGQAAQDSVDLFSQRSVAAMKAKSQFISIVKSSLGDSIRINGQGRFCDGKIVNFYVDGVDGETLVLLMGARGVYISSGSACRNAESEPSRVLLEMGLSENEARASVRISFSSIISESEAIEAAEIFVSSIHMLRGDNP